LPYNDYRQDLMGAATLTPSGSFEVEHFRALTCLYSWQIWH